MKLPMKITIEAKFDDIEGIVNEIASLPVYRLSEEDDTIFIERERVCEILKRHVITEHI